MEEYEEEYEVIPTSPLRKLEKRMMKVESTTTSSEVRRLIEQIIELIKGNQRIIDDVVKANAELRTELSAIPGKVDELLASMHEFIDILKVSASEESPKESSEPVLKKLAELVDLEKRNHEVSQATLTSMETIDKRLKRGFVQPTVHR